MTSRAPAWFEKKYKAGAIHKMQSQGFILKTAISPGTETKGNKKLIIIIVAAAAVVLLAAGFVAFIEETKPGA